VSGWVAFGRAKYAVHAAVFSARPTVGFGSGYIASAPSAKKPTMAGTSFASNARRHPSAAARTSSAATAAGAIRAGLARAVGGHPQDRRLAVPPRADQEELPGARHRRHGGRELRLAVHQLAGAELAAEFERVVHTNGEGVGRVGLSQMA